MELALKLWRYPNSLPSPNPVASFAVSDENGKAGTEEGEATCHGHLNYTP